MCQGQGYNEKFGQQQRWIERLPEDHSMGWGGVFRWMGIPWPRASSHCVESSYILEQVDLLSLVPLPNEKKGALVHGHDDSGNHIQGDLPLHHASPGP